MDILDILDRLQSHAAASGYFDSPVGTHEPLNPPGNGLTCAIWAQDIRPVAGSSGLAVTTGRLEFVARLYTSATQQPLDAIDPNLITATNGLLTAYSGDFDLGGTVRNVDLLGQTGAALSAKAGYLPMGGATYRVMDITLPLIVNDLWDQEASE